MNQEESWCVHTILMLKIIKLLYQKEKKKKKKEKKTNGRDAENFNQQKYGRR